MLRNASHFETAARVYCLRVCTLQILDASKECYRNQRKRDVESESAEEEGAAFIKVQRCWHKQFTDQLTNRLSMLNGQSHVQWDMDKKITNKEYMFALTYERERQPETHGQRKNNEKFRVLMMSCDAFRDHFGPEPGKLKWDYGSCYGEERAQHFRSLRRLIEGTMSTHHVLQIGCRRARLSVCMCMLVHLFERFCLRAM